MDALLFLTRAAERTVPMAKLQAMVQQVKQYLAELQQDQVTGAKPFHMLALQAINHVMYNVHKYAQPQRYEVVGNCFLDFALEHETGIQITLCKFSTKEIHIVGSIYEYLATQMGVEMEPIGAPGHFLIKVKHHNIYVDAFNKGDTFTKNQIMELFSCGEKTACAAPKKEVFERMVRNIISRHEQIPFVADRFYKLCSNDAKISLQRIIVLLRKGDADFAEDELKAWKSMFSDLPNIHVIVNSVGVHYCFSKY